MESMHQPSEPDEQTDARNAINQVLFSLALVLSALTLFCLHDRHPRSAPHASASATEHTSGRSSLTTQDFMSLQTFPR
ncbi:MAG TPA: hypothetical protein PLP17_08040 [Oligoflexia bacterium]|nr:hypothetical protein [Oligoflexia bacterium]